LRGDEREKAWASLMRAGNAGDGDAYRQLLLQLTPVLRAFARKGLAAAGLTDADAEDISSALNFAASALRPR
jgi:RNA polymerase sigma-70 factor (ECF subfamily)